MSFFLITIAFFICLSATSAYSYFYFKEKKKTKKVEGTQDTTTTEKITLSKKQLETTFDAITDLICALDGGLRITRVNRSYSNFTRVPIPELLGRHCWEVFWKASEPCEHCPAQVTFATGKAVLKHEMKMPDIERPRHFTIATYPVGGVSQTPQNVIECIRDSTEEKIILEQLIRSEKLASIGTMTAGIAHEMINPLSGISGTASNMLAMPDKYGLNGRGVARVTAILDSASRASAIVKDLLHLSRKEEGPFTLADVNSLVMKAVEAVRLKGFPAVEHTVTLDSSLGPVQCDPIKIQQVVINLLTNATQSVLEKSAACASDNGQFYGLIRIITHAQNDMVRIDISDNGSGIPDDIKGKIFDPFFTTRPPGEGTGLGLSICQKIVDEHDGRIVFESTESLTTFSIFLPLQLKDRV